MVSNVSVEYGLAQAKLDAAKTPEEKLAAMLEMKSYVPTHKAAEKMRAELNRKISELKTQLEKAAASTTKAGSAPTMYVKKEGVGQVVIIGVANSGKSTLLNALVGKELTPATPYPYATMEPVPGMMHYEGSLIQLVEVPAIMEGSAEGKSRGKEILAMVRNADAVVIAGDVTSAKLVINELAKAFIYVNRTKPPIDVKHSEFIGIQISGKEFLKFPVEQLEGYLRNTSYSNSTVIITGEIKSLAEVSEALNEKIVYKKAAGFNPFEMTDHKLVDLKDRIFVMLDAILVFTKKPGADADMSSPFALRRGATVEDLAKSLHKDIASKLKYARVWGSAKFPGQRVGPEYELKNKDIVEISF